MKAIQAADRGGYDALRLVDIPRPQPRAGQALVRVDRYDGQLSHLAELGASKETAIFYGHHR